MKNQAMGEGLKLLQRLASADFLDRYGLRKQTESVIHTGVRLGFGMADAAGRLARPKPKAPAARLSKGNSRRLFDLTPTEEQEMVGETTSRFAADALRPAARGADDTCDAPLAVLGDAWALGIGAMAVPEELGGYAAARSPLSNTLILESLAEGDMALALAIAAPLGVINLLVDFGTRDQQERILPLLGGDELVAAAAAILEPHPLFDPWRLRTRAIPCDGGYELHGRKCLVPLATQGRLFVVAAELLGAGPRLFLVEPDTPGLSVQSEPTMGLRGAQLGGLALDGVRVARDALLGGNEGDPLDYRRIIAGSRLGWCALTVGCAAGLLDYVKQYCAERVAFGEPITNRQSVAFSIADMALELDGMRLVAWRAAARAEQGLDNAREAYLAKLLAADKGMRLGTDAVQLLGGHGYVKDHPVELWYRHLRAVGVAEGVAYV